MPLLAVKASKMQLLVPKHGSTVHVYKITIGLERCRGKVVNTLNHESAGQGSVMTRAIGAQLAQLFILPFGVVDKCLAGET